jgi:hypothetical protein
MQTITRLAALAALALSCAAQTDWLTQIRNKPFADAREYDWFRTNGKGASGDLSAPGANSVTVTPCPKGPDATDTTWGIAITDGVGTAEGAMVTGGTCTSGAATGTLEFTTINAHTGAWKIRSGTAGGHEGLSTGSDVMYQAGNHTIYTPITVVTTNTTPEDTTSRRLRGAGANNTRLVVDPSFALTHDAVIIMAYTGSGGAGPVLEDFEIAFTQPDSANRADYTHWPPAIKPSTKSQIRNVNISLAWVGIDSMTATNGWTMENVTMSAFSRGVRIDDAFDSVYARGFHYWPFRCTADQTTAFISVDNIGVESYRMDDLHWTDSIVYGGKCALFRSTATGFTSARLNSVSCDNTFGIDMTAGFINASNVSFAMGATANMAALWYLGGVFQCSSCTFTTSPGASTSQVNIQYHYPGTGSSFAGFNYGGEVLISNSVFKTYNNDIASVYAQSVAGDTGTLVLTGNKFFRHPDIAYTQPSVFTHATAPSKLRLVATGNLWSHAGTGAGPAFQIQEDDAHYIVGNRFEGWSAIFPTPVTGIYQSETDMMLPLTLQPKAVAFAGLGAPAAAGTMKYCTDCIANASTGVCEGSSSGHLAVSNGTNWMCN